MKQRRHIIVHDADTVATVLDGDIKATQLQGGLPCAAGIPFGHKVALRDMTCGAHIGRAHV